MGMFSKDPAKAEAKQAKADGRAQAMADKARAKAQKKGVEVAGAVAVGHTFDDSADQFLVIFPDRVELVSMGKLGSLFRSGAGTESIPMARVSSTECRNQGIWSQVEVHTSGNSIEFKCDQVSGPYLRQAIIEQVNRLGEQADVPSNAPAQDVPEQLRKLGELHQAGVLTDDEFATKKAELLDRM
ncbi:SHOCT domain-containing protein [Nocardioides piscis]|nr:SHOCT domain-containing protein [Nocardioides piscis]